jgi:DUF4097 and DUF4098 domain-containing protein YvlB
MRTLTTPEPPPVIPGPPPRGQWAWAAIGLATIGLLAWPLTHLITHEGDDGPGQIATASPLATRTITISQSVSSLSVESYGAPIQVTGGAVHHVTVTEAISYPGPGQLPDVTAAVSNGRLTLAAPSCANDDCSVGFTVTVPTGVAVTAESDDGSIAVSGLAGANLDSGGGPVQASHIAGPLTVSSENGNITVADVTAAGGVDLDSGGGPVQASHIAGPLTVSSENGDITVADVTSPGVNLDSGGGPVQVARLAGPLTLNSENGDVTLSRVSGDVDADTGGGSITGDVSADRASVLTENGSAALTFDGTLDYVFLDTGGGPAQLTFDQAPTTVMMDTENGSATLSVPGGPYAVTATTEGAAQTVDVPTSMAAQRSITVSTEGGPLEILPR